MACPPMTQMLRPLLELAMDGQDHRLRDAAEFVSEYLDLSDADRKETTSSGHKRYRNRTAWARTHLSKAGLLEDPKRGYFRITELGRKFMENNPPEVVDHHALIDFSGDRYINAWKTSDKPEPNKPILTETEDDQTPEERIESAYNSMRQALSEELLRSIIDMPPSFFEDLVVKLLVAMGYGGSLQDAGQAIGGSGDGGIDGIIKEDKLGLDTIYIQAKRYSDNSVGRPAIQAFAGALQGVRARKGVFLTTSTFARPALDYVKNIDAKIVLIDGPTLAKHMIDFGVGVTIINTYEVKQIDLDFFNED